MRSRHDEERPVKRRSEGEALVVSRRGEWTEYVHVGHAAVVDADGRLVAWSGDPGGMTALGSAARPFAAVPLILGGLRERNEWSEADVALLAGAQADAEANCRTMQAGALALCRRYSWPAVGYTRSEHPLQKETQRRVAEFAGIGEGAMGVVKDDCGFPGFVLPLWRIALMYARLAAPPAGWADGMLRTAADSVAGAMLARPDLAGSDGSLVRVMLEHGAVAVNAGAGRVVFALPGERLGIAIAMEADSDTALPFAAAAIVDNIAETLGKQVPDDAPPSSLAGLAAEIRSRFPGERMTAGGEPLGRHENAERLTFADGLRR
ncbi:hypothetical protein BG53_05240 [Paenibacillus darwinianus]|uniref:Asparaginase n=1 Tax=Paenibacillus darwinianus TaxID=1380763 RepID=A0A9W5S083_9BACL|nr:asparaginase [Paenibacillus darwinianus]EXX85159.1 hypothetical protein BG52_09070 [Paenibacillus darwinianus]EXX86785.1 hypothetical protein CH50_06615 [Paenibacillus darwinianus]EXX86798.1 hypothetical protein BG53_05240 [Paenibacillus darwinianus]